MRFYLIRHGETAWNLDSRWQGCHDVPLNETGKAQALHLRERLQHIRFNGVYVSDLCRAQETAALALPDWTEKLVATPALREMHFGEWEGRRTEEILQQDGERFRAYRINPLESSPPGGESFAALMRRVADWWHRTEPALDEAGNYAVVAHGGSLRGLLFLWIRGLDPEHRFHWRMGNTGVSIIEFGPHGPSIALWNQTSGPLP